MRRLLLLALLLPATLQAQTTQQLQITGTTPYSTQAPYSVPLTLNGLPAGCLASISGNVITFTTCSGITITMTCTTYNLTVPATAQCSSIFGNTNNFTATYSSTNPAVASVSASGLVTAVGPGSCQIVATSQQDTTKMSAQSFTITGPATTVTQDATVISSSSGQTVITTTGDPIIPGTSGNKLDTPVVGQSYDYAVSFPASGSYYVQARLGTDATTTGGTYTVHFEAPPGTRISTPLSLTGVNQWTTVPSTQIVTAPVGVWKVRLVIDSVNTASSSQPAFIHWFQFIPKSASSVTHSVTLNWTPPPPAQPCSNPITCPIPPGSPPSGCTGDPVSYNIYRSQTSGSYGTQPLNNVQAPSTTYTDTAVTPGTYYYKVTSYNANACQPESAASNEIQAVVPSTAKGKVALTKKPLKKESQ